MKVPEDDLISLMIEGKSQKEISEILNCCTAAVEKNINKLKKKHNAKTYFQLGYLIANNLLKPKQDATKIRRNSNK